MSTTIDDLYRLTLVDGLPATVDGKPIRYRVVTLRETTVADERWAEAQAERVMVVGGQTKLMVSEGTFRFALTVRHIESLHCDGQVIPQAAIDLDLAGRLSSHDLGLIEARVFLITLAAEVRYGNMTEADFQAVMAGSEPAGGTPAPQRTGQAAGLGQAPAQPGHGPALLADYAGSAAHGPADGHGA